MKTTKQCNICEKTKPLDEFYKQKKNLDGYQRRCKLCANKLTNISRNRRYKEDKVWAERRKDQLRSKKYGLTLDTYLTLKQMSDGKCMICSRQVRLVVDHDHLTHLVRGMLCYKCNAGLGNFSDNLELLKFAVQYLEDHLQLAAEYQ